MFEHAGITWHELPNGDIVADPGRGPVEPPPGYTPTPASNRFTPVGSVRFGRSPSPPRRDCGHCRGL